MLARLFFTLLFLAITNNATARDLKVAMGSNLPPMHFIDPSGNLTGFEVDLVNLYTAEQNLRPVFLDPAKFNTSSLDMVRTGKADMAVNSIAITNDRMQLVDFSDPYFRSGAALLINKGSRIPFDFHKRTYLVINNSLYAKLIASEHLPRKEVRSIDEAVALLENEKLPAYLPYVFVFDWTALQEIAARKNALKILDFTLDIENYGAAFKHGGDRSGWNEYLARIRQDGRYQRLVAKWFSGNGVPSPEGVPQRDYRSKHTEWTGKMLPETVHGQHVAAYLPILNTDLRLTRYNFGPSPADAYYAYLMKHYNKTWLPHLEELFFKAYPSNVGHLFYDFIIDNDITDMIPSFFSVFDDKETYHARYIDQVLAVMSAKHPELKTSIEQTYNKQLEQRTVHISFPPGCADENNSIINITLLTDNKRAAHATIDIAKGKDADIKLLPHKAGTPTRLQINGITGTLKDMTVSGDTTMSIVNINKGVIASYSLPSEFGYVGISDDGKTIYLRFKKLLLFLDVESDTITRIESTNPLNNQELVDYAYGRMAGLYYFKTIRADKDTVYYFEDFRPSGVTYTTTTVFRRNTSSPKLTKITSFLGGAANPVVLDGKLFSSDAGYDSCIPFNVVDLQTGLKVDTGQCGGIVPVGPHELFHCGQNQIIDTRTLIKRILETKLPCSGTGGIYPHPIPGHYIYTDSTIC